MNASHTHKLPFFSDPSHGWLRVPKALVAKLAMPVTRYSYQRGLYAYLEEDCDMQTFHDAMQRAGLPYEIVVKPQTERPSCIRSYERM